MSKTVFLCLVGMILLGMVNLSSAAEAGMPVDFGAAWSISQDRVAGHA